MSLLTARGVGPDNFECPFQLKLFYDFYNSINFCNKEKKFVKKGLCIIWWKLQQRQQMAKKWKVIPMQANHQMQKIKIKFW